MNEKNQIMKQFLQNVLQDPFNHLQIKLPPERTPDILMTEFFIPMPDGCRLRASLAHPKDGESWPVILIRNPYVPVGHIQRTFTMPLFARYGYACIVVNVRGSEGSEGEWHPFVHETEDGQAVIDWIAEQKWCNGKIGTFGESYLGISQFAIADYEHEALKTCYIGVAGATPYDIFYRRGMFRPEVWSVWAGQMMGDQRFCMFGPEENIALLQTISDTTPALSLGQELIGTDCDWYTSWITNTRPADAYWTEGFWKQLSLKSRNIKRPIFLEAGWFDIFLRSQIESYRQLPESTKKKSRFLISPRCHNGIDFSFPNADKTGMFSLISALEWFDYQLMGFSYPHKIGGIDAYSIGDNLWKEWDPDFPKTVEKKFYLSASENHPSEYTLTKEASLTSGQLSYTFDPADPVPSCGGQLINSSRPDSPISDCSVRQPPVGERADVISFISAPLEEPLYLAGSVSVHLFVSSSAEATAFSVKLMEVHEDGTAWNIRDDITDIRWINETDIKDYTPNEIRELTISMTDVSWMISKGYRIRIDISSSNAPAYHVHPNVTECWAKTKATSAAKQTIYCGGNHASCIILPDAGK